MKRREILQRRQYAAIPKATLARPELSPSAKLVYAALIGHLFSDQADSVFPSAATLATKTGQGRRTVRRALTQLIAVDLIAAEYQPGKPTIYRFPTSDTPAKSATVSAGQPRPDRHTPPANLAEVSGGQPRPKMQPTPANLSPTPANLATTSNDERLSKELSERTPQAPDGEGPISGPEKTKGEAIDALAAAYAEATGRTMPDAWVTAAGREYETGDRQTLLEIDAEAIRRGMAFADKRNLAFAFRTLILAIHQKPRPDLAAARARADQAAAAAAEGLGQIAARHKAASDRAADEALAYFQTLAPEVRQYYRDQAAKMPGMNRCGAEGMELIAAHRAKHDAQTSPIHPAAKRKQA